MRLLLNIFLYGVSLFLMVSLSALGFFSSVLPAGFLSFLLVYFGPGRATVITGLIIGWISESLFLVSGGSFTIPFIIAACTVWSLSKFLTIKPMQKGAWTMYTVGMYSVLFILILVVMYMGEWSLNYNTNVGISGLKNMWLVSEPVRFLTVGILSFSVMLFIFRASDFELRKSTM